MRFEDLEVWRRSLTLSCSVYKAFKLSKEYGLKDQITRSSLSIPSNIAEGCGRNHVKELIQFLNISIASICELETQLYLTLDLELITKDKIDPLVTEITEIRKMINGYINSQKK